MYMQGETIYYTFFSNPWLCCIVLCASTATTHYPDEHAVDI